MERKYLNNNGITLVALVITIIVLLIIASIVVYTGTTTIKNANLQSLKTNMLLIEAKAREYVENANYELGISTAEPTNEMKKNSASKLVGEKIDNTDPLVSKLNIDSKYAVYKLSETDLNNMGIRDVKSNDDDGWYIVAYDVSGIEVKVYNTEGITLSDGSTKYCLDDIRDVNE